MPIMPKVSSLNANSVGIINAIRNNASLEYYKAVPEAKATTESIRKVGEAICGYRPRMNEFINALVNRIALVAVTSKMYSNPWAFAKKGVLEYGESIEEIFVDIAHAYPFDPENAYAEVFKQHKPDVQSMFHCMNLQTKYPVTVSEKQLRQAFLSIDGVTDLISRIVNSTYSAAGYDEFIMMKYILARLALDGSIANRTVAQVTDEASAKSNIVALKSSANLFKFMSSSYNIAGVKNFSNPEDLYVITSAEFDALTDVDVLAKAFNMDRANWSGRHVMIDTFAFNTGELERLDELLADDPDYSSNKITSDDNTALAKINAMIMDKAFFQVYDNLNEFTEIYNPDGLYWNEFYHVWRTYSASPFANCLMFTYATITVTSVTVNGPTTGNDGDTFVFTASVSATDFANTGVTWKIEAGTPGVGDSWSPGDPDDVIFDQNGRLFVPEGVTGGFKITATSVVDTTVDDDITIVIS